MPEQRTEANQTLDLRLTVADADLSSLPGRLARLAAQEIEIVTLAEAQTDDPDWLELNPRVCWIARTSLQFVGHTEFHLTADADTPGCLRQSMTAVRPAWRRQGIATALKLVGIKWAREHGWREIRTSPRASNAASVGLSENVGFRPAEET